mgnify:CR=1 FL=1
MAKQDFSTVLITRRRLAKSVLGTLAVGTGCTRLHKAEFKSDDVTFAFPNLEPQLDLTHHVAEGYRAEVLIRWGDQLFDADRPFLWEQLTASEQARTFGYNNDFLALIEHDGHWLLTVNHESTSAQLMFEGQDRYTSRDPVHTDIEMAAHGLSILELQQDKSGRWSVVKNSPFTRRITADTPMIISGPCAGYSRLKTPEDPTGTRVKGTVHNCSGGLTPWGTILTCEENILYYFGGEQLDPEEKMAYKRYHIGYSKAYIWYQTHKRFDLAHAPKQPNRFGWVVEIDPTDPNSMPIKRTALGRFYHESANPIQNHDGRIVIYMGDDGYFEYLYRFVSAKPHVPHQAKSRLEYGKVLDEGELSVAKFHSDGTVEWIPLIFGTFGLTPENGFHCQEDVLIESRRAGDVVGATQMDRCEDVEPNPKTNKVYINCTKNQRRGTESFESTNPANPRIENHAGHTIELNPPNGDHTASVMEWDMLLLAGDLEHKAAYGETFEHDAALACPDNAAIDPNGRLWITTDGAEEVLGIADAIYAVETTGARRGQPCRLFSAPKGAEITGPCFSPDGKTLFLSVQHPGRPENGWTNCWPDFDEATPARPSIVVIQREDGGVIGG